MGRPAVLITGATGHIGFRTLVLALDAGYRAHVTSRSEDQVKRIKKAPSIKDRVDHITFFYVPEMTADDAYFEAIKDVEYVIHLASPIAAPKVMEGTNKTYEDVFYNPAKLGTLAMLKAAVQAPSVKRVVITSTIVAVEAPEGKEFAGPYDVKTAPDMAAANKVTDFFEAYTISKVMAHNAADDFVKSNKVDFDLVRVLPGYTQGANELHQTRAEMMSGTNGALLATALGQKDEGPKLTGQVFLEDVAKAHVLALKAEYAANGDNLIIAGNGGVGIPWDEVGRTVEKQFPKEVASSELKPVKGQVDWITKIDVTSSEKALGYKFAGVEEMVKSVIGQYLALRN